MGDEIDDLMTRLATRRPDVSLDGLEAAVLRDIGRRREAARADGLLAPVRLASVAVALAMGVTAGGIAAARTFVEPRQLSTFSTSAYLAPSTLLEGTP